VPKSTSGACLVLQARFNVLLFQLPPANALLFPSPADCCDGTDELSGCKNTCIEKNSAKRDALRAKIDEFKASLEKKAQYAASAAGVREHIKQRHANVDGDIASTEQELQKLTGAARGAGLQLALLQQPAAAAVRRCR
jgi:hypothetical protein